MSHPHRSRARGFLKAVLVRSVALVVVVAIWTVVNSYLADDDDEGTALTALSVGLTEADVRELLGPYVAGQVSEGSKTTVVYMDTTHDRRIAVVFENGRLVAATLVNALGQTAPVSFGVPVPR